ncbi:MAG: N5-carboxyaminoimidazole ribonucleotide mutase [Verrucomicrobia subdivision 3 bacterium]|nr:N5-carboxyaminoimidazole ribonucleotide mutase [Limisphaerales bacterium]MCS1414255.1 N5-carboxyaminoimidazole ribonucleotide mutase [Limisphaerales bacterium]
MTSDEARKLLESFKIGQASESDVLARFQASPFAELDYAKVDTGRSQRQGFPEVILGSGKAPKQIIGIARALQEANQPVLVTRVDKETVTQFRQAFPESQHHEQARCLTLARQPPPKKSGMIAIATGGTSDIPIAEEAAVTADFMGNQVERIYDIGVACIHRVLDHIHDLRQANVIIVVAGMEGALPSVVAGLVDKPIIAVPTSIGYGANFGGVAALLGMLNSCGSGVTVVNIDNGFGAAFSANQINRLQNQST